MLALASLVAIASAETPPRLVAPAGPIRTGQVIPLRVFNTASDAIVIDGCVPIELERKEGAGWIAVASAGCDAPIVASVVTRELNVSVPAPEAGTWRAVLSWGAKCAAGLPFALAACSELGFVRSDAFDVVASQNVSADVDR